MANDFDAKDGNGLPIKKAAQDLGSGRLADQVVVTDIAATSTPLAGSTSGSGTSAVFTPQLGRVMTLSLWGTWAGSVTLQRSTDGGTTKLPVTVGGLPWGAFTANCNEQVWVPTDAAETFYLAIVITSGTLNYRMAQ